MTLVRLCQSCLPDDAEVYTVGLPKMECDFCGTFGDVFAISEESGKKRLEELLRAELRQMVGTDGIRAFRGEPPMPIFDHFVKRQTGI